MTRMMNSKTKSASLWVLGGVGAVWAEVGGWTYEEVGLEKPSLAFSHAEQAGTAAFEGF